jgi:SNF2 family DNA or RNA helicase
MGVIPRVYRPRPYAPLAMDHFANVERCALFAKPGMGKTTMVMTFLERLHNVWGEDAPTLVLGPKRVAQHVWPDEVGKWRHLTGMRVVPIIGTADERARALHADAPVFSINYENLVWLRDHFKRSRKAWPFRTVVADESTALKNFRTQQGGVRARALAEFAHKDVTRWINLTGTPAPNGLIDLWGQTWFLDAGQSLGRTFSSFQDRYFAWKTAADAMAKGKNGVQQIILQHSQDLIHEKLAGICLTLDPKDWFDLADPVVNIIEVDLPRRAQLLYKEFERELFMQIDGFDVEAFTAAAKSMKCLQLANGTVYVDEGKSFTPVHDAKLEALGSLVEEMAGEPVLVAYHFKPDLARLKAYFPEGLDLSTADGMAKAKAGQGRVWFGHPQSIGKGVDGLQEHCCTVAFFAHWWDLELHDQFIERVGPMRQMQSGKNKVVHLHYIVARGTIDQVVVARRDGKRGVQDLLLEYMKGKK